MRRFSLLMLVLAISELKFITTLPGGAPESVCHSLLPFHSGGIRPQLSYSPYRIEPSNSAVNQGGVIRINIIPQSPELMFGGFMLHARNAYPPHQVIGRFAPSNDGQVNLINCGGFANTATHTSPSPKQEISLQWQAPSDFLGEVIFK